MKLKLHFLAPSRDEGSISNLEGARHFKGTFSLRKKGLSKNKKGTSLFIAKPWGTHAPSAPPVPTSMAPSAGFAETEQA